MTKGESAGVINVKVLDKRNSLNIINSVRIMQRVSGSGEKNNAALTNIERKA